jgi:hypothetical protein
MASDNAYMAFLFAGPGSAGPETNCKTCHDPLEDTHSHEQVGKEKKVQEGQSIHANLAQSKASNNSSSSNSSSSTVWTVYQHSRQFSTACNSIASCVLQEAKQNIGSKREHNMPQVCALPSTAIMSCTSCALPDLDPSNHFNCHSTQASQHSLPGHIKPKYVALTLLTYL